MKKHTLKLKNRQGFIGILIACVVVVFLIILVFMGSAADVGSHKGANSNGKMITSNSGAGQTDCSKAIKFDSTYYPWVKDAAAKYMKGDEAALIAMIQIESSWNPKASNGGKATGLGQFMASTARGKSYPQFNGGSAAGINWTKGTIYDISTGHPDDARFDPKRSIYAAAQFIGSAMEKQGGSVGAAYQESYHSYCKDMSKTSCQDQLAEAKLGRSRLEKNYNELKSGACTTSEGGSGGEADGAGCNNVPDFKQGSSPWGSQQYGGCSGESTVSSSGCGVSAASMVLKFYGKTVDPGILAKISASNGYRVCGSGTSYGFFPFIAKKYGLKNENTITWDRAMTLLKQGKPIIASGDGPIPFTGGGHYIVLTCLNSDGTISVNDSAGGKHPGHGNYPIALIKTHQHFLTAVYP